MKSLKKGPSLERSIDARAHWALERLLRRGGDPKVAGSGHRDYQQARKYASAARSWCQSKIELPLRDGKPRLHSRRKEGATYRLWSRVIELVDAHLAIKS